MPGMFFIVHWSVSVLLLFFQFLVQASANSSSGSLLTDQATVTIIVTRNDNAPIFIGDYNEEIPDTTPLGSTILTVRATDADGVSA